MSPDELQVVLGKQLQELRIAKNLDQVTTAEKAGISEKALRNLEAGCVFRSMWAPDSIRSGHQFLFDVGSNSVVMWAAFSDLP